MGVLGLGLPRHRRQMTIWICLTSCRDQQQRSLRTLWQSPHLRVHSHCTHHRRAAVRVRLILRTWAVIRTQMTRSLALTLLRPSGAVCDLGILHISLVIIFSALRMAIWNITGLLQLCNSGLLVVAHRADLYACQKKDALYQFVVCNAC